MSIIASELQWYKSETVDDTINNGGRMSSNLSPTQVKNNVWPDVSQAERIAGSTKYRKMFIKVSNDDDITLVNPRIFVETYTPADDNVSIFEGTQNDIQDDLTGSERLYGCGQLDANVIATATSMDVLTEGVALDHFQDGDLIRISDKTDVDDGGGNEEFVTISGAPSYSGDVATISFTPALANGYSAAATRVASVIEASNIIGASTGVTVVSGGGAYDDATYPVELDSIGSVEQDWTLTFTSPTAFDIVGDTLGNVGSGNISTDATPNNPDFSKPYFTLQQEGFSGTFSAADTLSFTTSPAAAPIWYKRTVPAAAASFSANKVIVAIDGESA